MSSVPAKIIHVPVLKTMLSYKNNDLLFDFDSIVDSGADFCVFPAKIGAAIGLDIYEAEHIITNGIGGQEALYFHKVKVEVIIKDEPWTFECRAGFSTKLNAKGIGLLGRDGFFDLLKEF